MKHKAPHKAALGAMRDDRRGVAAAEFAIIALVMIALLFGVYNLGQSVHELLLLRQALRAGAVYASSFPTQLGPDTSLSTPNNGIVLAIQEALPANMQATASINPPLISDDSVTFFPVPGTQPYFGGLQGPPFYIRLAASVAVPGFGGFNLNLTTSYDVRIQ